MKRWGWIAGMGLLFASGCGDAPSDSIDPDDVQPDAGDLFDTPAIPDSAVTDVPADAHVETDSADGPDEGDGLSADEASGDVDAADGQGADAPGSSCAVNAEGVPCDDGTACTLLDRCTQGVCQGLALDCADGQVCTTDGCDPSLGCVHLAGTGGCDDGDPCSVGDFCDGGTCQTGPEHPCPCAVDADCLAFEDANPCNGALHCAEPAGGGPGVAKYCAIQAGSVPTCPPPAVPACATNACNPADGLCKAVPIHNGDACSDNNPCTSGDVCFAAQCQPYMATDCDDGDLCTLDSCSKPGGCLHTPDTLVCDDGFACTLDTCATSSGCSHAPLDLAGCTVVGSLAEPFNCGASSLSLWQLSDTDLPSAAVRWGIDAAPFIPYPHSPACSLNINSGEDLNCAPGQTAISASVTSPLVDLTQLPLLTPVSLTFYSAGNWPDDQDNPGASVSIQTDGGPWVIAASLVPSTNWEKQKLTTTVLAGHTVRLRWSLDVPCGGSQQPGWFVDDVALFPDVCAQAPSTCGTNVACTMSDAGNLDCSTCQAGYQWQDGACVDIDECLYYWDTDCHWSEKCTNTVGGYLCGCGPGTKWNGTYCADINECYLSGSKCPTNTKCQNDWGSYACICPPNFLMQGGVCGAAGGSASLAMTSCLAIHTAFPALGNGTYWLDFDAAGPQAPAQYLCDMTGGGWTRLLSDDFESGTSAWSSGTVSTCGEYGKILGGFGQFGAGASTSLTVTAPTHTQAKLGLDYIRIDSWNNETGWVGLDGQPVWSKKGSGTIDFIVGSICGATLYTDYNWGMQWTGDHSGSALTVTVSSDLDQSANDESFGVDNVVVWVK